MEWLSHPPNVGLIRAWLLTIGGCAAVVVGFLEHDPTLLFSGFAVLGGEPVIRAAANGSFSK